MEPIKQHKRAVSAYIPYRTKAGANEYYMQMRDSNAKTHPNVFSVFGGGIEEGETPEDALKREVMEELTFEPKNYRYFAKLETANTVFNVFIEEVSNDFESKVTVCEGEYGKFLSYVETQQLPDVSNIARLIVENVSKFLLKQ